MAKTYTYKHVTGENFEFALPVSRIIELEKKYDESLLSLLAKLDKLFVSSDIVAAAISEGAYSERIETAQRIYTEICDNGGALLDFQLIALNILCIGGIIPESRLEIYKKLITAQNELLDAMAEKAVNK